MENINIRHRSVLRQHYTIVSNVLLRGYRGVSDGAKLTYLVIDSFDWADGEGMRKGFAYPTLEHLANIRATSARTVRRHLSELEKVGLITRHVLFGLLGRRFLDDQQAWPSKSLVPSYESDLLQIAQMAAHSPC